MWYMPWAAYGPPRLSLNLRALRLPGSGLRAGELRDEDFGVYFVLSGPLTLEGAGRHASWRNPNEQHV